MYPGKHAARQPDHPAVIMAQTGEVLTYGELEARSNRLAHLFRARGLNRLDHYAIFMENNAHYVECCSAGARTGIYYTCVNSFLTPEELAYILNNSESRILITSEAKRSVAAAALKSCPKIELCLIVDGRGRRRAGAKSRSSDSGVSRDSGRRRGARNRDALFLRHHRTAERYLKAAAAPAAFAATAALRFSGQALALSRRHDLSLAGSALSFGAAGGREPHHRPRRYRHHHGDVRRRARICSSCNATRLRTASSCRPCSRACSSCRKPCGDVTTCPRSKPRSMPPRRVRCK